MILNGAQNGKHTSMILIDLQKAFDTLDQKILLDKTNCIGFSDKRIKWFHSYLTNRAIFVSLGSLFGSRDHKLRSSPRIYIGTFVAFAIHK